MFVIRKIRALFSLKPNYENRVFGLDLLRALAIIFVVIQHGEMLEKATIGFPWIPLIDGVELFFVLSGFLIGGILIKLFESDESFGVKTIANFWVRRWLRTLPCYYLVLILNIIVVYFGIIKEDFSQFNWKFFLFLQNLYDGFNGFFWESWSLSVEEWFYLLFPIGLGIAHFCLRKFNIKKRTVFLMATFTFFLIPFLALSYRAWKDMNQFWFGIKMLKIVIYRIDSIALGLFAAFVKYWHSTFWFRSRKFSFIIGIIITIVILHPPLAQDTILTKIFSNFFPGIGCVLLLPMFDTIKKAPEIIVKIFTHISLISYSIYLVNMALVAEVITTNFPTKDPFFAWSLYGIYWFAVLVFSTLLYKYYEKPIMDLRDHWKIQ